jgi:hypothetical protein
MTATYDVRVRQAEVYKGGQPTTDHVRWTIDGKQFKKFKQFKEAHRNKARAEICRADPVSAACKGRAFSVATGLPVSAGAGLPVCPARAEGRMCRYEVAYDARIREAS